MICATGSVVSLPLVAEAQRPKDGLYEAVLRLGLVASIERRLLGAPERREPLVKPGGIEALELRPQRQPLREKVL